MNTEEKERTCDQIDMQAVHRIPRGAVVENSFPRL